VILAESFSAPIAIRLAAEAPPNLKALVICAGFIESDGVLEPGGLLCVRCRGGVSYGND